MADTALHVSVFTTSVDIIDAEIEDVELDDAALDDSLADLICRFESRDSREALIARLWATLHDVVRDPKIRLP